MSMFIGEALAGEGNEIAHIDLLIGAKTGPVGVAFANALANQKRGPFESARRPHTEPDLQAGDRADHQGHDQGRRSGRANVRPRPESRRQGRRRQRRRGIIPKNQVEDLVIFAGVFIHWDAKDNAKIYKYNYEATKLAIQRAMGNEPKIDEILAKKDTAKHPIFES